MSNICLEVHPVYGAIYQDGEFVQRGAVLGLSTDTSQVVIAPVSGWIRLITADPEDIIEPASLRIEICPSYTKNPVSTI